VLEVVSEALSAGAPAVQLRVKSAGAGALLESARELRALTRRFGALLFVNDRVDVALAAEADAVQLGFRSPPLRRVRPWFPGAIGMSCHTARDLERAALGGASYAVLSPVFGVPEKGEPLGVPQLERFVAESTLPVVALGGIGPDEVTAVRAAGAVGVAVIRALRDVENIASAARALAAGA
jgi:thiamine-phosphate pyrophosphorylase